MKQKIRGMLLLLITAAIWGTAFVAQSVGLEHLGAFTFNTIRSLIGALILLPVICKRQKKVNIIEKKDRRTQITGGLICGIMLCVASNLQQLGISYSTVGKSAFLTTLYIVIVPLLGLLFHKKVNGQTWMGVILATVGLYLLCMKEEGFCLQTGDIYLLLCALFFSFQIMAVDYYSARVDGLILAMMQFLVTGVLSAVLMTILEHPSWNEVRAAAFPLFYAGAFSCGIAYTLQILGQKYVAPSIASLIMSLESVIATLAGWVILHEVLTTKELVGCALVFGAVLLTQIPLRNSSVKS